MALTLLSEKQVEKIKTPSSSMYEYCILFTHRFIFEITSVRVVGTHHNQKSVFFKLMTKYVSRFTVNHSVVVTSFFQNYQLPAYLKQE